MREFLSEHWKYGMGAIVLHLVLIGFLAVAVTFTVSPPPPLVIPIEAVMPDPNAALRAKEAARKQKEQQEAAAAQRAADERRKKDAEAEAQRKADEVQKQAEQERQAEVQRQAEAKRQQEQAAKQKQVQAEQDRQRKEQQAAVEKQRVAEIQRKQKDEADRKTQAARESELKNALAQEESVSEARGSSLMAQYVALLTQAVERHWTKPLSWKPGMSCTIKLTQTPGGTVLSADIGQCDGDSAVRTSIQNAVLGSSPLPTPPDMRVFDRNLTFVFKPTD